MQQTNWIILASKDRGTDYGVGTFIRHLSQGLSAIPEVMVYIFEIGITTHKSFTIRKKDKVSIFSIPLKESSKEFDSIKNQEKLTRNIVRLVSKYLTPCSKTVIHMNYVFQYFIGVELRRALEGKLIFTQHIYLFDEKMESNFFDTENQTYQSVDKIIAVAKHGKDHLIKKGIVGDKIKVIHNGIDQNHFKYNHHNNIKEKYGLTRNEKLILYSGRIDPVKGLDYLCSAMELLIKKIPDYRLVIAGNGSFESLINCTKRFSTHISFLGFIPFEDLVGLYHVADIGVIPSLEEQCSYVALEMLHSGLPVVASNLSGLKEIFVHGKNALLADTVTDKSNMYGVAPDVNLLKDHMCKLLHDDTLRGRFSQDAVNRANRYFTLHNRDPFSQ